MKYYLIYKITNLVNNKIYIGAHETMDKDDSYMGSGKYLKRAQQKYGIDKFKKEILFECDSRESMFLKETEIVDEEFVARLDTYNLKVGGDGGWDFCNLNGKRISIENQNKDKMKMIERMKQTKASFSQEKKDAISQKLSISLKLYNEIYGSIWLGKCHSEKTRKQMSKSHQGKHNGKLNSQFGKMWICNDLTKESKSILKTDPIPNGWRKGRICKK